MALVDLTQPQMIEILAPGTLGAAMDPNHYRSIIGSHPIEEIVDTLRINKVLAVVRKNLTPIAAEFPELFPALDAALERPDARFANLASTWELVQEVARAADATVRAMKGASARWWYQDPSVRHLGDIDLWVPDIRSAFAMADELIREGWNYRAQELPWVKTDPTGREYGVVNLRPPHWSRHHIDIHFGSYSALHCASIPISPHQAQTTGWPRTSSEETLACMVANAAGDGFITLKDVNDLFACATSGQPDWSATRTLLESAGLSSFAARIAEVVGVIYDAHPAAAIVSAELGRVSPADAPFGRIASNRERVRSTVRHAWRFGKRTSFANAVHMSTTAARYYTANLTLRAGTSLTSRWSLPKPRHWSCVRLVPVSVLTEQFGTPLTVPPVPENIPAKEVQGQASPLTFSKTKYGAVAQLGDRMLLPTVFGKLDPRLVAMSVGVDRTE
jgi:hypothetical protein